MVSAAGVISTAALAAPKHHLGVLIAPEGSALRQAAGSAASSAVMDAIVLGRPIRAWRAELQGTLGLQTPVIATGHQAEFFHAGVLAKNFAVTHLAKAVGGSGLFVLVDSDVPKSARIAVPDVTRAGVRRIEVPIPGLDARLPMEAQPVVPFGDWLEFFTRVASPLEHYENSALQAFQRAWLQGDGAADFCSAFDRGRVAVERAVCGDALRAVRVSALAERPAFRAFWQHIALHAEAFAGAYNAARDAYRLRHRIKNVQRPLPSLSVSAGSCELPFWAIGQGRRRDRLFVRRQGDRLTFLAGEQELTTVSAAAVAGGRCLDEPLLPDGWRVRPRALTLSAFARLFLADVFVHGIGGAKYDEMTDELVAAFVGAAPPMGACVTATLHLPLPAFGVKDADVRRLRQRARDVIYNPQRYVIDVPKALLHRRTELIEAGESMRRALPSSLQGRRAMRGDRRRIHMQLQEVNQAILAFAPHAPAALADEADLSAERAALDRVSLDREYFFGLHTLAALRELDGAIRHHVVE